MSDAELHDQITALMVENSRLAANGADPDAQELRERIAKALVVANEMLGQLVRGPEREDVLRIVEALGGFEEGELS